MGRKKARKVEDFKQVKIKVGKRLPNNKNVTKLNFKSGSIVIRPQMPLQDIENLDEAKRLTFKSYLKQLSHHNAKRQAEAAIRLKSLINGDNSYKPLYNDALIELMKNYATVSSLTNKAMVELASSLFGKFSQSDLKEQARRIWLSLGIGMSDIIFVKQQTSVKMLFVVIDKFPTVLLETIRSASFLLELVTLTEIISFDKIELINRINLIFINYVNNETLDWSFSHDFSSDELEIINEYSEKLTSILKNYVCPNMEYIDGIGRNYDMISPKKQQEILLLTEHIRIGFSTIRNLYLFLQKFYKPCSQLVQHSSRYLAILINTQIISTLKHVFPFFAFTPLLVNQINSLNVAYCFVVCDSLQVISATSSQSIVSSLCDYLVWLLENGRSIKLKNWSAVLEDGLCVVHKLVTAYYMNIKQKFYGGKLNQLIITMINNELISDMSELDLHNLLQTIIVLIKNLDFSKFKHPQFMMENMKQFVNVIQAKMVNGQSISLLELLYYCLHKSPVVTEGDDFYVCLATRVADNMRNYNFLDIALNFISLKNHTVLVYFLKYCINYIFNCTSLRAVHVVYYANSILDILWTDEENVIYFASFLYTCSVGFTADETKKINEIILNNKYLAENHSRCLVPIEMLLNESYFENKSIFLTVVYFLHQLDKSTVVYQRSLILMVVLEKGMLNPYLREIYMDSVQSRVKQWLRDHPNCCHVNLAVSLVYINKWAHEKFECWPIEQYQLLLNFLEDYSLTTALSIDSAHANYFITILKGVFLNEETELPVQFLKAFSKELDNMIKNKKEDFYLLENTFQNLLLIFQNHVFPSSLKALLAQKLKGLQIDSTTYNDILDKIE